MTKSSLYCLVFICANAVWAQVPYGTAPNWVSAERTYYGTGCALDDINCDGYLDLAVSNGNDMLPAPNFAYINRQGVLPESASWVSSNATYSGQCDFGDYDHDGYPEWAVANYISSNWRPNLVNVYDNINGSLEPAPSWLSADSVHSFRVAWGDADGDGDLDLAVATGEIYHSYLEPNLIYYNVNGVLQTSPWWVSADSAACYDVQWVDIDRDGDLDLTFCESGGPVKIYLNFGDSLATSPSWQTADSDNYNSMDFADINGDGYLDLAVAANAQLGGSGHFKLYRNINGTLENSPFWISSSAGYGSEAAFSDVDNDGEYDLIGGRWWGQVYVYLNRNGVFRATPDWTSSSSFSSVVENIVFGDIDGRGDFRLRERFISPESDLFYLSHRQLSAVDSVRIDAGLLPRDRYCASLWSGWLSVSDPILDSIEIFYRHSPVKDMVVSNWDRETFIFYNGSPPYVLGDANGSGLLSGTDVVYLVNYLKGYGPPPNPYLAGDTNGDCLVNGLDVTYLVNYFKGGGAPPVGDCP